MTLLALIGRTDAQLQAHPIPIVVAALRIYVLIAGIVAVVAAVVRLPRLVRAPIIVGIIVGHRHILVDARRGQTLSSAAVRFHLPGRAPLPLRILVVQIVVRVILIVVIVAANFLR